MRKLYAAAAGAKQHGDPSNLIKAKCSKKQQIRQLEIAQLP